jgi:hypothetical protein
LTYYEPIQSLKFLPIFLKPEVVFNL